jgi:hypothetical protein
MQIERMLEGSPVHLEDLDDEAYVLVAATLPRAQECADAASQPGLRALRLPDSYPLDSDGSPIEHAICQATGAGVRAVGLRGVWCRSACSADGRGRELAWVPANRRSVARAVWEAPLPLGRWRHAAGWDELGLDDQPDPHSDPRG